MDLIPIDRFFFFVEPQGPGCERAPNKSGVIRRGFRLQPDQLFLKIHPTAIIDSQAEIGEGVEIGPFAVIEAGARIGNGCTIHGHVQLLNSVEIGNNCEVGHGAVIGAAPQITGFDSAISSGVRIGANNVLREHVTIHRSGDEGEVTEIGRDNLLMVGSHLGHGAVLGDRNVLANNCLIGGHVSLGDGAVLGGGAAVHQYARIGSLCMIKGLTAISQDVPPFVIISGSNQLRGLNVIGMRRAGFSAATRQSVKDAFRQMFLAGLNLKEALDSTADRTWEPEAVEFIDFFRVPTERGICRP